MNTQNPQSNTQNNVSQPYAQRKPLEKVIQIEICRECRLHSSSTWHDESKYKKNYVEVKEAVESHIPGCKVVEKIDPWINLGAFEVYHEDQLIYSKKKSGLWPNAKAVAQRISQYFDDYENKKDVTHYGAGPEVAYVSPKKKSDLSKTGTNFNQTAQSSQRDMSKSAIVGDKNAKGANDDHQDDHHEDDSSPKQNKSPEKQKAPQEKPQVQDIQPQKVDNQPQEQPKAEPIHVDKVDDHSKDDASNKNAHQDDHANKDSGHEGEQKHD